MRALVTGVAGFVGSNIARALIDLEWEVRGIDSLTDYYPESTKLRNLHGIGDFQFTRGDLNFVDLDVLLDGVDVVFHEAGQPGVRASWGSGFAPYLQDNIAATQRLLEAARTAPFLKKLVYASSSSVYGDAERYPTEEEDSPRPVSPYGVTKLAAEHLCTLYGTEFQVPTVSLRYFTVFGPGQRPDMAFYRFLMAASLDQELELYGDGTQVRDFTFVDDVVQANILAATRDIQPGSVFNVAGGSHTSISDVFEIIESISGRKLRISRMPSAAGDVRRTGGSTERIRAELGWSPQVSLETGLTRQWKWIEGLSASEPGQAS